MKSTIIHLRLNPAEITMLDAVRVSQDRGELNRSELLRLLLHREHARRTTGRSVVKGYEISSDQRTGRQRVTPA